MDRRRAYHREYNARRRELQRARDKRRAVAGRVQRSPAHEAVRALGQGAYVNPSRSEIHESPGHTRPKMAIPRARQLEDSLSSSPTSKCRRRSHVRTTSSPSSCAHHEPPDLELGDASEGNGNAFGGDHAVEGDDIVPEDCQAVQPAECTPLNFDPWYDGSGEE